MKSHSSLLNSHIKCNPLQEKDVPDLKIPLRVVFPLLQTSNIIKYFLKAQNCNLFCFSSPKALFIFSFEKFIFLRKKRENE